MNSTNALNTPIRRACAAGPIALTVLGGCALALAALVPAVAPDYIDVEAEREAERAARSTAADTPGDAVSYGLGGAPAGALTRTLPPPTAPAADDIGGLFNQVQQLQQEVMRLNGIVEQQTYELRQLKEQSLERYLDIDRRLASGAAPRGANTSAAAPAASRQPASGAAAAVEQPGEAEAYRAAYALVRGQEFAAAVPAFTRFLQNFPDGR